MKKVHLKFSTLDHWGYLWLKYVTDVNLSKHCAQCLVGQYSKHFPFRKKIDFVDTDLDEVDAPYLYLCGVSSPYVWENNLHVAFVPKEGASFVVNFRKTLVEVQNAERIIIAPYVTNSIYAQLPEYRTCRNWQFANMISSKFGS